MNAKTPGSNLDDGGADGTAKSPDDKTAKTPAKRSAAVGFLRAGALFVVISLVVAGVVSLLGPFFSLSVLRVDLNAGLQNVVTSHFPGKRDIKKENDWLVSEMGLVGDRATHLGALRTIHLPLSAEEIFYLLDKAKGRWPNNFNVHHFFHSGRRHWFVQTLAGVLAGAIVTLIVYLWRGARALDAREKDLTSLRCNLEKTITDPGSIIDKAMIGNHLGTVIKEFASSHDVLVRGLYEAYPHRFVDFLKEEPPPNERHAGLLLWSHGWSPRRTANLLTKFLEETRDSVCSTVFMKFETFLADVGDEPNDGIAAWLRACNETKRRSADGLSRAADGLREVKRVHIVESIADFADAITAATHEEKTLKQIRKYAELFYGCGNPKVCTYDVYELKTKRASLDFFGDYVIFDECVVVKYDATFMLMEIICGGLVDKYSKAFKELGSSPHQGAAVTHLLDAIVAGATPIERGPVVADTMPSRGETPTEDEKPSGPDSIE